MAETLKPCPLCGSTDIVCFAEECGDSYDNVPTFRAVVGCCGCHEEGCDPSYDDEPCFGIEAYFRADHPLVRDCEDPWDIERVLERHMAERWNRRAEPEEAFVLMAREATCVPIKDYQLAPGEVARETFDVVEARAVAASGDVHALREAMGGLNVMRRPWIRDWNIVRVPYIGGDRHDR